jgi:hypothetical protein
VDAAALLRQSELFGSFPPAAIGALVAGSKRVACARNEDVFAEGDPAADLYVIESGLHLEPRARRARVDDGADGVGRPLR